MMSHRTKALLTAIIPAPKSPTIIHGAPQFLDVAFLEVELGRGGRDLDICEHAGMLPTGDQPPDLFKVLKFPYRHRSLAIARAA